MADGQRTAAVANELLDVIDWCRRDCAMLDWADVYRRAGAFEKLASQLHRGVRRGGDVGGKPRPVGLYRSAAAAIAAHLPDDAEPLGNMPDWPLLVASAFEGVQLEEWRQHLLPRPPVRGTRGFEWLAALPSSTDRRSRTPDQLAQELDDRSIAGSIAARFSGELRPWVEHVGARRGYRRNAAGDRVVSGQ